MKYCTRRAAPILVLAFVVAGSAFAQPVRKQRTNGYQVVVNHEEQYSIQLADAKPQKGWAIVGDPCSLEGCSEYLEKVWTDMRPLSLRKIVKAEKMDGADTRYAVVINHEEQYSIWLADRAVPAGWKPVDFEGSNKECVAYIKKVWTDMRPLSLRTRLQKMDKR